MADVQEIWTILAGPRHKKEQHPLGCPGVPFQGAVPSDYVGHVEPMDRSVQRGWNDPVLRKHFYRWHDSLEIM